MPDVVVREATEQEEAAYQAGWSDAVEQLILEKGNLHPDTKRALDFYAKTPGQGFDGDTDKLIAWLFKVALRTEGWFRFQADLYAESERKRTRITM